MMRHDEIEELLGAYALDAVEATEAEEIERHLLQCPRCRAEVAGHREVAALLGNSGGEAPLALWDKIADKLETGEPAADGELQARGHVVALGEARRRAEASSEPTTPYGSRRPRGRKTPAVWTAAAAAAAAAVVALGTAEIVHLDNQVSNLRQTVSALSSTSMNNAALAAMSGAHTSVELTSAVSPLRAEAVITPGGQAFVVSSDMPRLPATETYQLWGLVRGKPVSLGVAGSQGASSSNVWTFHVQTTMTALMVTAEPTGGTPQPTTQVLVQAPVNFR